MAQLLLKAGQNPLNFTGSTALVLAQQPWYTAANVIIVYAPNANNQGYITGKPGSNFGVTQLNPAPSGQSVGIVIVAKQDFTVDGSVFGTKGPNPFPLTLSSQPGEGMVINNFHPLGFFDRLSTIVVAGSGATVQLALNGGSYDTVQNTMNAVAALSDSAIAAGYSVGYQLTKASDAAVSLTLTHQF